MTATLEAQASAEPTSDDDDAVEPPQPSFPVPAALAPWHDPHPRIGWLFTALVTVLAAITRFWAVGYPHGKNFDEVYYATEAQELLRYGYEDNRGYMFIVHPPLGKWLIAGTSQIWGDNSVGWRIAPAIAGIVSVILITRITRRLLRSNLFGAIAGLLLAMDGLSLVLSRTALLDIFLQTFVLAGFGALVVDRDQVRSRLAALIADGADLSAGAPTLGPRPWRLVGGMMLGAACAVKWSALSFFVVFALLSLVWDRSALKAAGVHGPTRNAMRRSALPATGSLLAAPIAVYLLSYLGWFVGENGWGRHYTDTHTASTRLDLLGMHIPFSWVWVPSPIRSLGAYTLQAYRFHEGLADPHPYQSSQWSWLVLGRPVDFSYDGSSIVVRFLELRARDPADRYAADVVGVRPRADLARLALGHHPRLACRRSVGRVRRRMVRVVPRCEADEVPLLHGAARAVPDHRGDARARRHARPRAAAHQRPGARPADPTPKAVGHHRGRDLPRPGCGRLRLDVAHIHGRSADVCHLARAYVATVVGMS